MIRLAVSLALVTSCSSNSQYHRNESNMDLWRCGLLRDNRSRSNVRPRYRVLDYSARETLRKNILDATRRRGGAGPTTAATFGAIVDAIVDFEERIHACTVSASCATGVLSVRIRLVGDAAVASVVDKVVVRQIVNANGVLLEEKTSAEECISEIFKPLVLPAGGGPNTFMTIIPCRPC